jgi:mannose-6-phosphate isomerase-like protein (cupin superfamily)
MKRVITAEHDGRSYFARIDSVESEVSNGFEVWKAWGHDQLPAQLPIADGTKQYEDTVFPGPRGVRVTLTNVLPDGDSAGEPEREEQDELDELIGEAGFHRTDTMDIGWVISGEVGLQLDEGETVWLAPGDLVVQNGTHHAWRNRSGAPALMGFVTLGAERGQ